MKGMITVDIKGLELRMVKKLRIFPKLIIFGNWLVGKLVQKMEVRKSMRFGAQTRNILVFGGD